MEGIINFNGKFADYFAMPEEMMIPDSAYRFVPTSKSLVRF